MVEDGGGGGVVVGEGVGVVEGIEGNVAGVGAQNDRVCWKHWR